jgi:serine/threonine protein kinase
MPAGKAGDDIGGRRATTACDVYALGVLLYELLSGARPYDVAGKSLDMVLATVGEREPRRPSATAAGPGLVPYDVRRLRGDLDAIVLKAMDRIPVRRYASAQELSDDIARHLTAQPILAREPGPRGVPVVDQHLHASAVRRQRERALTPRLAPVCGAAFMIVA